MLQKTFPPLGSGRVATAGVSLTELRRIDRAAKLGLMGWPRRLGNLAARGLWPLVALVSILAWQLPRHGGRARRVSGRSLAAGRPLAAPVLHVRVVPPRAARAGAAQSAPGRDQAWRLHHPQGRAAQEPCLRAQGSVRRSLRRRWPAACAHHRAARGRRAGMEECGTGAAAHRPVREAGPGARRARGRALALDRRRIREQRGRARRRRACRRACARGANPLSSCHA